MDHELAWRVTNCIRSGSAAVVAAGVLSFTADAGACSYVFCDSGRPATVSTAPADGVTIPANAPGLVAETSWWAEPQALELDGGDAATPSATLEKETAKLGFRANAVLLLKLSEPLAPGTTYTLKAESRCTQFADAGNSRGEKTVSFTAGPPSALPTTVGSARVAYSNGHLGARYGYTAEGPVSGIDSRALTALAQITIEPSAELNAYLPLTRFSTYVDGVPWGESQYGHGTAHYEAAADQVTFRDFTRVFTTCTRDAYGGSCEPSGVPAGVHEVEIRAHVAGAATDPTPLRFQINLSCPDGAAPDASNGAEPDASGVGGDAGPCGEAGMANSSPTRLSAADDDGGCAIARPRTGDGVGTLSLAALVLAASAALRGRKGPAHETRHAEP